MGGMHCAAYVHVLPTMFTGPVIGGRIQFRCLNYFRSMLTVSGNVLKRRHGHGSSFRNSTQPNPSMKNIPLHTITTVMPHHKILQGPLAANVKSN